MTSMVNVGIIGCGNFGAELARIVDSLEGMRAAAVVGGADDSARRLANELGCDCEADAGKLASRPDIDAIVVASPNFLHKEHVLLAAKHGKHIFCEKPIALSLADCDEMLRACEHASVRFMAGHIMHFMGGVRRVKRMIAEGAIGRPIAVHAERTGWMEGAKDDWKHRPELTGGYLFHYIHELDLVQAYLGPAREAFLAGTGLPGAAGAGRHDILLLSLKLQGDALGTMQYGSGFRWGEHSLKINGTEGAVLFDFKRSEIIVRTPDGIERFGMNGCAEEDEDRVRSYLAMEGKIAFTTANDRPPLFLRGPMRLEMECFRDCLRGKPAAGEFAPLFDGTSARSSIATAEAAMASLHTRDWVQI
ncbi:Gfo/Idh/MocA family oxidoreductase [Paenibacillus doosanensis]|uniref:Gfo/Idh/MocA family protein n=1 Tax=Paenibacillus doosanensis TaxID=1229154 RepID=UPI00217FEB0F|nr:Gfo/Idh/MocA family oxidoreductase [Paenibacillus doosanensis]MCS7464796.1 Gfo/Idh/MocA family oxidoreductase [Paenibacillus doosanensis]